METDEKKILIVDDDAVLLRTMKDALSGTFKIYGANSGKNALKVLEKIAADAVLLDYEMPEMNGPEVLAALKGNPLTAAIPVFFLTGRADDTDALMTDGIVKVLRKGTPVEELIAELSEVV